MWEALAIAAALAGAGAWLARESRLANFRSPARTWDTLVAFWQSGSIISVRSCLTPESLAMIGYVLDRSRPEPELPPELLEYLTGLGGEHAGVYRDDLPELLKLARTNIEKFWFLARPRDPGQQAATPQERRTELGILRHIMLGVPQDASQPAPRVQRLLDATSVSGHEYARVVYEPMFAGFGLVDTYKRTGRVWRLDLASPLLQAAHASKTQFMPGQVVKIQVASSEE